MKKRKILVAILVVIAIAAFIVGVIIGNKQATSERHLSTVISSFLGQDYIWDVSRKKISDPEYIEVSYNHNLEGFFIMFPLYDDGYKMYYETAIPEAPDFWIETPRSVKGVRHAEFSDIFSICKRLQYETCFLKTSTDTVLIETIRIYRDGSLEAKDVSGTWHPKITCNNFILA